MDEGGGEGQASNVIFTFLEGGGGGGIKMQDALKSYHFQRRCSIRQVCLFLFYCQVHCSTPSLVYCCFVGFLCDVYLDYQISLTSTDTREDEV